jgi:hypothetical protein
MRTRASFVSLVCVGSLSVAAPASGQTSQRQISLDRFHGDYVVQLDGSVDVTETLDVRFDGSWNGIIRDLSLQHRTAEGRSARLDLDVQWVRDSDGNELEVEESGNRENRRVQIWVPNAEDAVRTVEIRYRVSNALRFFSEDAPTGHHDELYWNVTGNAWDMPIRQATARVVLPEAVTGLQAWAYTGAEGSRASDATIRVERSGVEATTTRLLSPGEGLTVSVTWDPGVVRRPSGLAQTAGRARGAWPLAIPFLVFGFMTRRWLQRGRDPRGQAIVVQYEPVEDMSPAEMGTLVDHRADAQDLTATLVDLAVQGYLSIEEVTESKFFGLGSSTDYVFRLRKPADQWEDLKPHERAYLGALFPGGRETVELSDLENKFYKHLDGIRDAVYDRLVAGGYYRERPDKVKGRHMGGAIVGAGGGFAGAAWVANGGPFLAEPLSLALGGGISALILAGFGLVMPARTEEGVRARESALGFKEFLDRVETDRYRRMITSPDLFERFLPYAMAFGVEERWAEAFRDLIQTPPEWYHGRSGQAFRTDHFTQDVGQMASRASSTMSSSPSSSGSGGGGSSGGGSGGGGGSGF